MQNTEDYRNIKYVPLVIPGKYTAAAFTTNTNFQALNLEFYWK